MINIPNDATHYIWDGYVKQFYRTDDPIDNVQALDVWSYKNQRWEPSPLTVRSFLIARGRCNYCAENRRSVTSRKRTGPVSRSKHWSLLVDECSYCGTITPAYTTGVSPKLIDWAIRYSKHIRPLYQQAREQQDTTGVLVTYVPLGASPTDGTTEYSLRFTR